MYFIRFMRSPSNPLCRPWDPRHTARGFSAFAGCSFAVNVAGLKSHGKENQLRGQKCKAILRTAYTLPVCRLVRTIKFKELAKGWPGLLFHFIW